MDETQGRNGCGVSVAVALAVSALVLVLAGLTAVGMFVGIAAGFLGAGLVDSWINRRE